MKYRSSLDMTFLRIALAGLEIQRTRIDEAIAEIQVELGAARPPSLAMPQAEAQAPAKRRFSAAARRGMAAAQRKRWRVLKARKALAKKAKP
jgi:hypothetical protein